MPLSLEACYHGKQAFATDVYCYTDPNCVLNVTCCCEHSGEKMSYLLHLHFSAVLEI